MIGKKELLRWIYDSENSDKNTLQVGSIDFTAAEEFIKNVKLIVTRSSNEDNFEIALFYNFISKQIELKNHSAQERRYPANSFTMGLVVELRNKHMGRYESNSEYAMQILLPLRNALCKAIKSNSLQIQFSAL